MLTSQVIDHHIKESQKDDKQESFVLSAPLPDVIIEDENIVLRVDSESLWFEK